MNSNMEIKIGVETIESFSDITENFSDLSDEIRSVTECAARCFLRKDLPEKDRLTLELKIMGDIVEQVAKYRDCKDTISPKINITFN